MSNIYIQEPPTTGKVLMKTTVGDIDLELWTKEAPKACKNFIQLCMEGYYNNTIFHRVVKGFIVQGGDPTGTGEGGESIYGHPFKDEFHTRLRFCRRGLLAMANAGKDDNGSQFFFTLGSTPELQNKHTIFGKVTGETIYNMLKLEEAIIDENERPEYPQKILKTEVLNNPFQDIVPRTISKKKEDKESKKDKKTGVKNFKLLSFGEEAEEDEEESSVLNKQYSGKGKSAHDCLSDPKLSSETVEPAGPPSKKIKEDRSSDWESDDDETRTPEELAALAKEKEAMKERIKNKLKDSKNISQSKPNTENADVKINVNEDGEIEEYYLGKDRDDERKRKAEEIRKEIRELKRDVQNEKKAKEAEKKQQAEKEENKKSGLMKEFIETQEKYKAKNTNLPKKGKTREDFTMDLLNKFKSKLQTARSQTKESADSKKTSEDDNEEDDPHDDSWMAHALHCEEKAPVLAKDASTKNDDWFEIYDPRNPLNKRRRGEKSYKSKDEKSNKTSPRHK
ncbi:peptidyl-prolyl cis-trans isomerase CWC27 homolog [Pseudomyrmex gracilis]|uniref:peptidyl-prolyl cis-trans isomerase CWC27 homolog n=1 Tax=Pseudomyrmex gracilis TaxID=219809 RepID=UPI0009954B79|nr:peptidyl-prolyl cis-trans isomerase CWC27 homolog [Pseudomyrmex gracilis]